MIKKTCKTCGKKFFLRPYRLQIAKYCSNFCRYKGLSFWKGIKNHSWKGGKPKCQICGVPISYESKKGKPSRFCKKHWMNLRKLPQNNPHWKGGKTINRKGYIMIYKPDHPFAKNGMYVLEHRLIMEQILGRYLKPEPIEIVHHINDNKSDNRPKNLMLLSGSEHRKLHNKIKV